MKKVEQWIGDGSSPECDITPITGFIKEVFTVFFLQKLDFFSFSEFRIFKVFFHRHQVHLKAEDNRLKNTGGTDFLCNSCIADTWGLNYQPDPNFGKLTGEKTDEVNLLKICPFYARF